MKRFIRIGYIVFVFLIITGLLQAGDTIFIKNGIIVPVIGKTIHKGSLLIENGKIVKIGSNVSVPKETLIIDASGKYVYPGLVALMTAVGVTGYPGAGNDLDEVGVSTPEMDPSDAINPEDDCIAITRMGGVTTVMTISGSRSVINGKSVVLNLEGDLAEDMIVKKYVAQIVNMGAKTRDKYPSTLPGVVSLVRAKLDRAKEYTENSSRKGQWERMRRDWAKYKMEMEAFLPVIQRKIPIVFMTSDEVSLRNALTIIKEYNLKGIIQARAGIRKYIDQLIKEKIPVIWAGTTTIPRRWEPFDLNYRTAEVLAEKGVLFAFDPGGWGPGSRNVRNLPVPASISVAHGLSEEDAIKAITINPAEILGIDDQVGSLEVGKTANVVIWTGSPIQMRSRVDTVIINGKIMPMTSVQTRLYDQFKKIVKERMNKKKSQ